MYLIIPKKEINEIFWSTEKYMFNRKKRNNISNGIIALGFFRLSKFFFLNTLNKKRKIIIKQLIFIAAFPMIIEIGNRNNDQSKKKMFFL